MTKKSFLKHAIVSSFLTIAAITAILAFCVVSYIRYSPPDENNTSVKRDTVTDVYHALPINNVVVVMSNGDSLQLVYEFSVQNLYSAIGYDIEQLSDLLVGKSVAYRRMNNLPWVIEINMGDVTINNQASTEKMIVLARIELVVLGLIMLPWPVYGNVLYLKGKYKLYKKAQKKQEKKLRNQHRKTN